MSTTSHTVYFDTSFYVGLCRADELLADQLVQELNALNIRHVISDVLIRELLTSKERSDLDQMLVRRVRQLKIAPYPTGGELEWEALLLSGRPRIDLANNLRWLHDEMTVANSTSIMARRRTSPEQQDELLKAGRPVLQQYGFPENFEQSNIPQVISAVKSMLDGFGLQYNIDWPENPTPDDLVKLSGQLMGILELSVVERIDEQYRIQDSSISSEDRPYQVAVGMAHSKTKKRLSNTLRDTEHIMVFVQHQHEIDLLQVDKAHEALIKRWKPRHHFAELGLAHRCFSADTPLTAITKVRDLVLASKKRC
jgi:hypothetical protein